VNIKTIRQWLPMIGGGLFLTWTGFLVLLSLLHSPQSHELPGTSRPAAPTSGPSGCVAMPDGLAICDEQPTPKEEKP
jgi:hypothetical protein